MRRCCNPLLISLAETREPLRIVNRRGKSNVRRRSGRRTRRCGRLSAGLRLPKVIFRCDTAFSQTQHLDRWNDRGVTFHFGYKVFPTLETKAEQLTKSHWKNSSGRLDTSLKISRERRGIPSKRTSLWNVNIKTKCSAQTLPNSTTSPRRAAGRIE